VKKKGGGGMENQIPGEEVRGRRERSRKKVRGSIFTGKRIEK
jgi:hypothetical protein